MEVPTLGLVARYLAAVISAWEELHGTERVFAIEPKEAGRIAGLIRIGLDGDESRQENVGYSLDSDFQGCGYATNALKEVVRLGFEDLARIRHRFGISSSLCWYWTRIGSRYPLWVVRRYARRVFGPFQERLLPVHRATLTWIANCGRAPTSASRRCSVNAVQRWSSYPGSRHSGSRCRFASTSAKTLA